MQKTILISGATGHIGSQLCKYYLARDYRVIGLKRRTSLICTDRINDVYEHPNFKLEYFDLTDSNSIWTLLLRYYPNYFINAAAQSHVKVSFDLTESTVDVVANGVLRILDACRVVVPNIRFFQFSSSEMMGNSPPPQNELTPFDPQSPYACAKIFSFYLVKNYRRAYKMFASNGILFNTEGETRGETFVTKKITQAVAKIKFGKQNCLYLGNVNAKRDWLHVDDSIDAIDRIINYSVPDDFVIASEQSHSVKEFCDLAFKCANLGELEWEDSPVQARIGDKIVVKTSEKYLRPSEVHELRGDASKIKNVLKWEPKISFEQLVQRMVDFDIKEEMIRDKQIQPFIHMKQHTHNQRRSMCD